MVYGASTFLDSSIHKSCGRFYVMVRRHFVSESGRLPPPGKVLCRVQRCETTAIIRSAVTVERQEGCKGEDLAFLTMQWGVKNWSLEPAGPGWKMSSYIAGAEDGRGWQWSSPAGLQRPNGGRVNALKWQNLIPSTQYILNYWVKLEEIQTIITNFLKIIESRSRKFNHNYDFLNYWATLEEIQS
jgi:hypothetical protein